MMHVAVDAACWWNDRGFGRFTREVVRALASRANGEDLRLTLVLEHRPARPAEFALPEVPVVVVGTGGVASAVAGGGARGPSHLLRMGAALARVRADVIFFPAIYSWVPVPALTPQLVTMHDAIPERHPELLFPRRRNRMLWGIKTALARAQARRILTVSEASASDLVGLMGISRERIDQTIEAAEAIFEPRTGVDGPALRARLGLPLAGRLLLYVGGFNPHKNVLRLLEALTLLKSPEPVALALVGDTSGAGFHDNLPSLRRWLADRPEVAARVALAGWVADDDLVSLYNIADALVFPSLAEGFGLPAVEAMACGCPVLASDRTSLPEVVGDGGLLFAPEDPAAIARAIDRVLSEPGLRATLSARALKRAALFSWDRSAELVAQALRRTAGIG